MTERNKEILKFLAPLLIPFFGVPIAVYMVLNTDPDLTDPKRREAVHDIFEKDLKSIQLPNQFTIRYFEKGGKSGSSILDSITYRTRLPKNETASRVDGELKRLGWSFWKKEDNSVIYCKGKFAGDVYFASYPPENSTDVTFNFILGLKSVSGADVPKECQK